MRKYDFTVFEYFQTDTVGHSRDMDAAVKIYETLDRFLEGILLELDVEKDSVIVVSDHGNIEDISIGTHTVNPVPTILLGKSAVKHASIVGSITDIAYLIRVILNERNSGG
jgi:bisphosphoglycerate-independent phosphoglycerate mutase (AlkP superfamily)